MPITVEEFLGTLDKAGVTLEALTLILTRSAILVQIESQKAAIARKEAEKQTAIAGFDAELQTLQGELNQLVAQSNQSL